MQYNLDEELQQLICFQCSWNKSELIKVFDIYELPQTKRFNEKLWRQNNESPKFEIDKWRFLNRKFNELEIVINFFDLMYYRYQEILNKSEFSKRKIILKYLS